MQANSVKGMYSNHFMILITVEIYLDTSKLEAVHNFSVPTNNAELKSFLGMTPKDATKLKKGKIIKQETEYLRRRITN